MKLDPALLEEDIKKTVAFALEEDIRDGDITALLIPAAQNDTAEVITREDCVLCGQAWVNEVFKQLPGDVALTWLSQDGDRLEAGQSFLKLSGNTRSIVTGERTALNFLQTLCGTASLARQYSKKIAGQKVRLLDTRKTIPGLRTAQKYAVSIGGCENHRIGLYDAFLIKENHITACGGIKEAVNKAKQIAPYKKVEVEVENETELVAALEANADIVMLDNFSQAQIDWAFSLEGHNSMFEISGNIDLDTLRAFGDKTHYVSSGSLTKHIRAVDLSMRIIKA